MYFIFIYINYILKYALIYIYNIKKIEELPFELEDGTTPVANKAYIYSGKNWTEPVFPILNDLSNSFEDLYIDV